MSVNDSKSNQSAANSQDGQPLFAVDKIFVKDLSVEVPNSPEIFLERDTPTVDIQLQTQAKNNGEGIYEITLTVTVTAKLPNKTVFLVEVGQAGIFRMINIPQENMEPLIAIGCPNVLFPYAREVISDTVTRAGFAPIVLQPVNFEAMYEASKQRQQAQQQGIEAPLQ